MSENAYAGKFTNAGTQTVQAKHKQPKIGTNKKVTGNDLRAGKGK